MLPTFFHSARNREETQSIRFCVSFGVLSRRQPSNESRSMASMSKQASSSVFRLDGEIIYDRAAFESFRNFSVQKKEQPSSFRLASSSNFLNALTKRYSRWSLKDEDGIDRVAFCETKFGCRMLEKIDLETIIDVSKQHIHYLVSTRRQRISDRMKRIFEI